MDKIWLDDICQLFNLDFNPVGTSFNSQLNILTKFAIVLSAITSLKKKNTTHLKRTILYITVIMLLYISLQSIAKVISPKVEKPEKPEIEIAETFKNPLENNPVGNPELKSLPLSSPATGPTQSLQIIGPASTSRVLGCSLDAKNWSNSNPEPSDSVSVNISGSTYELSPDIEAALTHNIPMDPSDEFYVANFSRQIYKIADDQNNYASSLYAQGPKQQCKQGSVFAHLGNPYTVYTQACSSDNGYGQSRRSGIYLKND